MCNSPIFSVFNLIQEQILSSFTTQTQIASVNDDGYSYHFDYVHCYKKCTAMIEMGPPELNFKFNPYCELLSSEPKKVFKK